MNLKIIRTDQVYRQVLTLSPEQGEALFRKEVLAPFRGKFARQGLSIEAGQGADALQILSLANLMQRICLSDLARQGGESCYATQ